MSARESAARILAVDDDAIVLRLLSRILVQAGYQVVECTGVQEALKHLEGDPFALVITDLHMPGGNGLDLARTIRSRAPEVPIILLSGSLVEEVEQEARGIGRMGCLSKPIDQSRLLQTIRALTETPG